MHEEPRLGTRDCSPGAEREMCCVLMIVLMIMLVPDTLAAVLVVDGLHFSERYARPLHS